MSRFKIYKDDGEGNQCWCWCLQNFSYDIIAKSEEMFLEENVEDSVQKIKENALCARIKKKGDPDPPGSDGYFFEYYNEGNIWCWRLKADNYKTMAIGSNSYVSESEVKDDIYIIKKEMSDAPIMWPFN